MFGRDRQMLPRQHHAFLPQPYQVITELESLQVITVIGEFANILINLLHAEMCIYMLSE